MYFLNCLVLDRHSCNKDFDVGCIIGLTVGVLILVFYSIILVVYCIKRIKAKQAATIAPKTHLIVNSSRNGGWSGGGGDGGGDDL